MRDIIEKTFNGYIDTTFKGKAIHPFLSRHERKSMCIDGLVEEVRKAELSNIGRRMDLTRLKLFATEGAKLFCNMALTKAEQDAMSQIAKQARIDEANKYERAAEILEDLEGEALDKRIKSFGGS